MNTPIVSVIVPIYNAEEYISMLIDSVLAQSFNSFELILINDGSIDSTPNILNNYAKKDCRVKVIHKANGGVSSARNCGLDNAQGKYIAFADNDDYMFPDNLETMVKEIEDYDLLICNYCKCKREEIMDYDKKRKKQKTTEVSGTGDSMADTIQKIGYKHGVVWNQLFSRSIIEEYHIRFEKIESEDELFSFENLSRINSVKKIDYEGYCWINNPNSLGSSHKYIVEMNWISKMEEIYERMEEKWPPSDRFKNIVNIRISHRLAVLCFKGYNKDSKKTFSERMSVWKSVGNDAWVKNRINLSLIGKNDRRILTIAKHKLLKYLFDPLFLIYGIIKA